MSKEKQNILFVCFANRHRSKTAEELYRHDSRYKVRSSGTSYDATRILSKDDLAWADKVFAADASVKAEINIFYPLLDLEEIVDIDVPDRYDTKNRIQKDELMKLLKERLSPYLGEPARPKRFFSLI